MFGALLEIEMSKKCTPLRREAHFEVSVKNWQSRATFGRSDVVSHGRRKGLCTLPKVSKRADFVEVSTTTATTTATPLHNTTLQLQPQPQPHYITLIALHYTTLHSTNYTTLHSTSLHYPTLNLVTLHYTTLNYTSLQLELQQQLQPQLQLHYITLH